MNLLQKGSILEWSAYPLPLPTVEACGSSNWQIQPCSREEGRERGKKEERIGILVTLCSLHVLANSQGSGRDLLCHCVFQASNLELLILSESLRQF